MHYFAIFAQLFRRTMSRKGKEKIVLQNIEIESIAAEGNSLARVDGKVLFVPLCIPGDVVDVRIHRKKSGYMEGVAINMVKPSPLRVAPFCDHYGTCGGCKWQILPYEQQLQFKQQQVVDQLTRIGHLELPEIEPILGSEKTREYRNKLEFTFSDRRWLFEGEKAEDIFSPPTQLDPADYPNGFPRHLRLGYSSVNSKPEGFGLGFHIGGAFDKVLDIKKCYLQPEPSNEIRNFVREYAVEHGLSFFNLREQVGLLRTLVVRTNTKGDVMVTLACTSLGEAAQGEKAPILLLLDAMLERFPQIKSLHYVINTKGNDSFGDLPVINYAGEDAIYEQMEDLSFKIGPKSFYQTNSEQAYRLYSVVREFADLKGDEKVYDLYTGTGTIAQFVSKKAASVIGIEYVPEAIEDAKINAQNNGITNCTFYAGDMKDILTNDFIAQHGGTPDVIILDPPRAGIHPDVAQVILDANPEKIVYVSCNPATQARDLSILSQKYRITRVRPVDMFPHTVHIENVVALERK